MGFFNKIFKDKEESGSRQNAPWIEMHGETDLQKLENESEQKTVVIFKHSTRCGISRMVKRQFEKEYNYDERKVKLYYLDLLKYRELSKRVAEDFGVFHESPQLLIIKNKNVVFHTSHSDISAEKIREYVS